MEKKYFTLFIISLIFAGLIRMTQGVSSAEEFTEIIYELSKACFRLVAVFYTN